MNKKMVLFIVIVIAIITCIVIFNNKDKTISKNETSNNVIKEENEITKEEATKIEIQNAIKKIEKQGIKLKEDRKERLDISAEITGYSYKANIQNNNQDEEMAIYVVGPKSRMELFKNIEDGEVTIKTDGIEEKALLYGNILIRYNKNEEIKKIIIQAMS